MANSIDGTSDSQANAQRTDPSSKNKTKEQSKTNQGAANRAKTNQPQDSIKKAAAKNESPTQKADDVRPPFDGPHYVVAVTKRENPDEAPETAPFKYDPQSLKAKARSLLKDDHIDSKQRGLLKEILGPEEKS